MSHDIAKNYSIYRGSGNKWTKHFTPLNYIYCLCTFTTFPDKPRLCKLFEPRLGQTERRSWSGSKRFDTLIIFLKEFLKKKFILIDNKIVNHCPAYTKCLSAYEYGPFFMGTQNNSNVDINPLYTNSLFLLVYFNRLWTVQCTYLGVSGYNFSKSIGFFCLNIFFIFTNSVGLDEMQHFAAFVWVFTVCKSTCLAVSQIQRVDLNKTSKISDVQ